MKVTKISEYNVARKELGSDGSYVKELITRHNTKTSKGMLGVSVFKPRFQSKVLTHSEDELVYVMVGSGKLWTPYETISYTEGDSLFIPAGIPHKVINDGESDLMMIFFFTYPEYPPTEIRD
jgi:quercetin dioxygenase-like cupin family protein